MCVSCLAISAMTLFAPVTDMAPVNGPAPAVEMTSQTSTMTYAAEAQLTLGAMMAALPQTPDAQMLRDGFTQLQQRLEGVNDDQAASLLVEEEMDALQERVLAAPNADRMIEILFELQESKLNQQAFDLVNRSGWLG